MLKVSSKQGIYTIGRKDIYYLDDNILTIQHLNVNTSVIISQKFHLHKIYSGKDIGTLFTIPPDNTYDN